MTQQEKEIKIKEINSYIKELMTQIETTVNEIAYNSGPNGPSVSDAAGVLMLYAQVSMFQNQIIILQTQHHDTA
jgi:hypothetical protein